MGLCLSHTRQIVKVPAKFPTVHYFSEMHLLLLRPFAIGLVPCPNGQMLSLDSSIFLGP